MERNNRPISQPAFFFLLSHHPPRDSRHVKSINSNFNSEVKPTLEAPSNTSPHVVDASKGTGKTPQPMLIPNSLTPTVKASAPASDTLSVGKNDLQTPLSSTIVTSTSHTGSVATRPLPESSGGSSSSANASPAQRRRAQSSSRRSLTTRTTRPSS